MGDDFSHAHAACLAAQLPHGARCLVADDPHQEWSSEMWMLWHIERNIDRIRWVLLKHDGESVPTGLPYPGRERDDEARRMRFEVNRAAVDSAFNMDSMDGE